jgi:membrane protein DedA with SNARE-associated domain
VNPAHWHGVLAYLVIYLGTAVESEVVFVGACALVSAGKLSPLAVLIAGGLGGSTGDQFWYYALRGRLHRWLMRFPALAARHDAIVARVHRHSTLMVLGIRFLPGLRITLCAACAYAGVPAAKFTALDLVSAFCFAALVMLIVSWGGPGALAQLGLRGKWGAALPAVIFLLFLWWLARETKKLDKDDGLGGMQDT